MVAPVVAGAGLHRFGRRWRPPAILTTANDGAGGDGCHRFGNALALPFADGFFDTVLTSCTYGNRMADHHEATDGSRRNTYRHALGRALHPENSGAMQWGADYRAFHVAAWAEVRRVLSPGGVFVLNVKDHIRRGAVVAVTDWHIEALTAAGFVLVAHERIACPGNRYGQNGASRVAYESVIKFQKQEAIVWE